VTTISSKFVSLNAGTMLSLIKNGVLYEVSEQAPSPSKDFVNMLITTDEVHA